MKVIHLFQFLIILELHSTNRPTFSDQELNTTDISPDTLSTSEYSPSSYDDTPVSFDLDNLRDTEILI